MAEDLADYVGFEEFRQGLPAGRFHVIINPKLARRYLSQQMLLVAFVVPLLGIGIVLALAGHLLAASVFVAVGVIFNRVVMAQSGRLLVNLALRNATVYEHVTTEGIMEVRRRGSDG